MTNDNMPTPYYDEAGITIYHGDCRELLPEIPDGSVDLVLTDPPYGIEGGRGGDSIKHGKGKYVANGWEDTPDYVRDVCVGAVMWGIRHAKRVVLTCGRRCMWSYPPPDDLGCFWTPASPSHGPWGFNLFTPILYYGKDQRAGKGALPSGKQVTTRAEPCGHPCPKPLTAWKWLLHKASADDKDVILDPFMGSGTTLVAAKELQRKAIGIEIEERYCEIAARRLAQGVFDWKDEHGKRQPA